MLLRRYEPRTSHHLGAKSFQRCSCQTAHGACRHAKLGLSFAQLTLTLPVERRFTAATKFLFYLTAAGCTYPPDQTTHDREQHGNSNSTRGTCTCQHAPDSGRPATPRPGPACAGICEQQGAVQEA